MRRVVIHLLAGLGVASVAAAIEVTPPNPVPEHSLVQIKYDAGDSVAVVRIVDGLPADIPYVDCGNGQAAFTGPPGGYLVGAIEGGRLRFYAVRIGGTGPTPPGPDPPVPPPPDPDVPDTKYGLTKWVFLRCKAMAPEDRKVAVNLAPNYRWAAKELEQRIKNIPLSQLTKTCVGDSCRYYIPGTVAKTIYEQVLAETRVKNRAVHGGREAWNQYGIDLAIEMNRIWGSDASARIWQGWCAMLNEVAGGLELVK